MEEVVINCSGKQTWAYRVGALWFCAMCNKQLKVVR